MTTELHRGLGKVEGELSAVKAHLEKIDDVLERIDSRLARIEAGESERKGAFSLGQWLVGIIGGAVALVVEHFWRAP